MYSGTTLTKWSGALLGAHQKIDRVARVHLNTILPGQTSDFPSAKEILRFEGIDGPDGIKRKNPAKDEPWHYFDPYNEQDHALENIISDHYDELVKALKASNRERAAFEAAWLAHALVDGLTPAHHYPYEEELVKLRGGEGIETRTTLKGKILLPGDTTREQLNNNWKMWGAKGLLTTHALFEWGIATIIAPLKLELGKPTAADLLALQQKGLPVLFRERAHQVADLNMYGTFYEKGWTPKLARQVRRELIPLIVNLVTVAWYGAILESAGKA